MKTFGFIIGAANALNPNPVPVMGTLPGWQVATHGAQIDIRMFYDLFCPDSRDTHYALKDLMTQQSPVAGKTYKDIMDMRVSPYVLPYHLHSF